LFMFSKIYVAYTWPSYTRRRVVVSTVLSVRVRRELKQEAEQLGINIREVVEKALEEAIREARRKQLLEALEEMREQLQGLSREEWVRIIREERSRARIA